MCSCKEVIAATAAETYICEAKVQSLELGMPEIAKINYLTKFDHPLLNTFLQGKSSAWRSHTSANSSAWRSRVGFSSAWTHPDFDNAGPPDSYDMGAPRKECRKCMLRIASEMKHPQQPSEDGPAATRMTPSGFAPGDDSANQGVDDGEVNFFQQMLGYGRKMLGSRRAQQPYSYQQPPKYEPEEMGWRIFDESPDWSSVLRGMCSAQEITDMEEGLTYFWSCDSNRIKLDTWSRKVADETVWIDANPGKRIGMA